MHKSLFCALSLGLLLSACKRPDNDPIVSLEGARYEWVLFNHRLSHLEFGVDEKTAWASVVGGTSTTGIDAELDGSCDPDACEELPFIDEAAVRIDWSRVDEPDAASQVVRVSMTADADGEDELVSVELKKAEELPLSAMIRSFRISTDHPLDGGDSCYDPAFGWLPTRLALSVGDPVAKGDTVTVEVSAAFESGNTLEEFRQCIDDVIDRARVGIEVEVLVIAGGDAVATADLSSGATWALGDAPANPDPQDPPAAESTSLGLSDPVVGWQRMDWAFHNDDPDGRGGYLRSLDLESGPKSARGTATNFSKGTQLSGFDYTFEGTVVGHDVGGRVTRGSIETSIPVELDATSREPVVQTLGRTD